MSSPCGPSALVRSTIAVQSPRYAIVCGRGRGRKERKESESDAERDGERDEEEEEAQTRPLVVELERAGLRSLLGLGVEDTCEPCSFLRGD